MACSTFVKILIKAPNQLIDDQTVECERNWTVKKLKQHLYSVYPCKPHPTSQKLIYSGQLLSDEAVLSEVLRTYEGLENNTIHLVCSIKDTTNMMKENVLRKPLQACSSRDPSSEVRDQNIGGPNANLRNEGTMIFPSANSSPQELIQQSIMFQQAYMQYLAYFNQGMMNVMTQDTRLQRNGSVDIPQTVNNINREESRNPRVENDEIQEVREEPQQNRDWLEWFYILSRLFILFTVVYFYSSPQRFIMVIAMALILINVDVFRWRRGNNNIPEGEPSENDPGLSRTEDSIVQGSHFLKLTWSFMKTFFLSLIPDNREV